MQPKQRPASEERRKAHGTMVELSSFAPALNSNCPMDQEPGPETRGGIRSRCSTYVGRELDERLAKDPTGAAVAVDVLPRQRGEPIRSEARRR